MATVDWETLAERWAAEDARIEAYRSKSPILWWLRYRLTGHFWSAVRWLKGVPRFLFSALPFRLKHGFWYSECWALDSVIARFALPRLRHLRTIAHGHPVDVTWDQWFAIIHEIEWFLEWHIDSDSLTYDRARYERAGQLFGKYFGNLWD
jgi:hypothetical protein